MKSLPELEEEKRRATYRRLLLSKQLFLHGMEHAQSVGALSKMIAVYSFHNAIETALRAIFLRYEIRAEKQLNIDFEQMLNEIDNYDEFKRAGKKLPYRQDMRNLNQLRNLVLHHAVEPEASTMDDWRVFTRQFLVKAFKEYFEVDLDKLSSISLVNDPRLHELLEKAMACISTSGWNEAARLVRTAFELSARSITRFLPDKGFNTISFLFSSFHARGVREPLLEELVGKIYERIEEGEFHVALLTSGISLPELMKLRESTPSVKFASDGTAYCFDGRDFSEDDCRWAFEFVTNSVINWQLLGLEPMVTPEAFAACHRVLC